MKYLIKVVVLVIIALIIVAIVHTKAKADESCETQCNISKFVDVDALVVCNQVCKLNETNQAILEELKRIAQADEKMAGGQ